MTNRYDEAYEYAARDPEGFWAEAARAVTWEKPWDSVLDSSRAPFYRWFKGGMLNTCFNALDRHVDEAGRGDRAALIYDSPVTGTLRTYSYRELRDEVAMFAGALAALGVTKGDRVLIYMPMIPQAAMAMLACARLGAIHSVVFGGFAAKELATRIDDAAPKVVVAGSCGIEPGRIVAYKPLLDEAINLASSKPEHCVIYQREQQEADLVQGRDLTWDQAVGQAKPHPCVPVAATDPLYILYTSGTTGIPKGVVRDNGGHAVALSWTMPNLYDIKPDEVWWTASDVGWVVGHSYIVYAPLLHGCATVMYEGKPVGTPDAGAFWRVISQHKVKSLFTAPTAFRAIRQQDPEAKLMADYDMSSFDGLFLAGERLDPDTLYWAQEKLRVPIIDHWWQTETGWCIAGDFKGLELLPIKEGSATKPSPGHILHVLDSDNQQVPAGEIGSIGIKLPLPPGTLPTLWNNNDGFRKSYLDDMPGYYKTGDAGYLDEEGYVFVMTRTDDIINVAGHRLSTGGMEEILASHPDVAECAVMGVNDALKGQVPLGMLVLNAGVNRPHEEITQEIVKSVRDKIGPVAAFKMAMVVQRLPKTRSGKILRGTMQKIANGEPYRMPATIDDASVIAEITDSLKDIGYPKA